MPFAGHNKIFTANRKKEEKVNENGSEAPILWSKYTTLLSSNAFLKVIVKALISSKMTINICCFAT